MVGFCPVFSQIKENSSHFGAGGRQTSTTPGFPSVLSLPILWAHSSNVSLSNFTSPIVWQSWIIFWIWPCVSHRIAEYSELEGSCSPTLQWMAHRGIEPVILALLTPCSNQLIWSHFHLLHKSLCFERHPQFLCMLILSLELNGDMFFPTLSKLHNFNFKQAGFLFWSTILANGFWFFLYFFLCSFYITVAIPSLLLPSGVWKHLWEQTDDLNRHFSNIFK